MGVGAYITDGVVGAKSFQFNTLSGNAGKVVVTNADQVMSTTINAGQLDFITGLTSQAANSVTTGSNRITQEYNATVGDISTLVNRATLDAGLALVPNLLPLSNTWTGAYNQFNGTVSTMGSNRFIQPYNAVSADISTLVNRATLDASIAGLGAGILNLNNEWTGTNTYYSTLTTAVGQTTSINGALSTSLVDLGFTSASFTTSGITGAYTPPLGTITNPSGSTYQITQTAAGRSIMAISGFTPSVGITYIFEFNINCTIGTATISVEQDNILVSPALYQLTTGFNVVKGSFTYNGTPNTVVFKIYTGVASWNAQWDSFTLSTYSVGLNANMNALTVNNRFTQRYNALVTDVSTLVNRATMDAAIGTPANFSGVSIGSVPYESASNVFSNSLMTQGTADLGYTGASFTASTGIASITFSSPTYTANSNASVQGIINATALPTSAVGLPCIATFTALTFPLFATAPYPYFTLTNGATVVYTSAVGASGTIVMPFTPTSTTLFVTICFKSPPTGVSSPVLTWTNFTITTPAMITTGFNTTIGRQTVGSLVSDGSIVKRTVSDGSLGRIAGGDASFSPYLEFLTGGTSRGYLGDCNASNMYIASENGATLNFLTQGALRMTIDSSGFTTLASKELRAATPTTAAGGQIRLTNGTSGNGYGNMLYNDGSNFFFLLTNNNDAFGNFNALRPLSIDGASGRVNLTNKLTVGGTNSSGVIDIVNPNGSYTHFGWTDNQNYFRGLGNIFDSSITLNSVASGLPRIQSSNNNRSMRYDDPNAITYLINNNGATPIPFTHSSWANGYTVIARNQGITEMALGFGVSNYRAVIMSLAPGISWGELILSGGTIYTACFGTINNYTNGGGWVFVSDKRVKKDIKDIKTARSLQRIMALKPKTYKKVYRQELSDTPIPQEVIDADHIGLLAQDVMETNPHCVSEWVDDKCICDGDDGKRLGIAYADINIHMVGAIQELKKQNDAQQKEIDELKEMVKALMAKLK
jgi:hypothetical protein